MSERALRLRKRNVKRRRSKYTIKLKHFPFIDTENTSIPLWNDLFQVVLKYLPIIDLCFCRLVCSKMKFIVDNFVEIYDTIKIYYSENEEDFDFYLRTPKLHAIWIENNKARKIEVKPNFPIKNYLGELNNNEDLLKLSNKQLSKCKNARAISINYRCIKCIMKDYLVTDKEIEAGLEIENRLKDFVKLNTSLVYFGYNTSLKIFGLYKHGEKNSVCQGINRFLDCVTENLKILSIRSIDDNFESDLSRFKNLRYLSYRANNYYCHSELKLLKSIENLPIILIGVSYETIQNIDKICTCKFLKLMTKNKTIRMIGCHYPVLFKFEKTPQKEIKYFIQRGNGWDHSKMSCQV